ncbi:anti-sigma 70 protein [Escherichia phage vb_EcoM-VR5]|uniref:AsiA anti-sigma 70 protein n=5 Tax=Dhakavirus TaxID=1914165 RepID=C4MZY9_9CAUD|nr:anti-sigma factor [Escherichia phage JS10]YP_009205947.1 anti-sigma factor [Escherichia phage vb_EcoM-VR5]YP_010094166.1 anti-sigma factor [Enterobacteria phage vB_EcoM_IME281]YP_010094698.1 anti-sigma factor [Enterobacteria phage vB_EcoM_IME341]QAY00007.1 anti-sigma 70 protein [Escherichia phage EcWhh-1]QBP35593.1 anti-sigma factor [Phage NC-G]QHR70551.1 anti-sigma factor A protein [Escherichia phage dhaeg]QHR72385.1 anti-sigma factor A protein [Escherichia phage dhabil]QIN95994.1 10 kD
MTKIEIVSEIATIVSILIKTDCEDIMQRRDEFIAFLNELGIRNEHGKELNGLSFNKLFKSLTEDERDTLIEQFNEGYEDIHRYLMMYTSNF